MGTAVKEAKGVERVAVKEAGSEAGVAAKVDWVAKVATAVAAVAAVPPHDKQPRHPIHRRCFAKDS